MTSFHNYSINYIIYFFGSVLFNNAIQFGRKKAIRVSAWRISRPSFEVKKRRIVNVCWKVMQKFFTTGHQRTRRKRNLPTRSLHNFVFGITINFRRKCSKSSKPYFSDDSLIDRGTWSENRMEKDIVSEEWEAIKEIIWFTQGIRFTPSYGTWMRESVLLFAWMREFLVPWGS